ncbi:MAG: hypothetical protein AB7P18_36355 [Candidatus Binatia bacterium]
MSLVRLRQQQALEYQSRATDHETRDLLDEAHLMLTKIYNWFTEGFDTEDLQAAKALLTSSVKVIAISVANSTVIFSTTI